MVALRRLAAGGVLLLVFALLCRGADSLRIVNYSEDGFLDGLCEGRGNRSMAEQAFAALQERLAGLEARVIFLEQVCADQRVKTEEQGQKIEELVKELDTRKDGS